MKRNIEGASKKSPSSEKRQRCDDFPSSIIESLPREIFHLVVSFLDFDSALRLGMVDQQMRRCLTERDDEGRCFLQEWVHNIIFGRMDPTHREYQLAHVVVRMTFKYALLKSDTVGRCSTKFRLCDAPSLCQVQIVRRMASVIRRHADDLSKAFFVRAMVDWISVDIETLFHWLVIKPVIQAIAQPSDAFRCIWRFDDFLLLFEHCVQDRLVKVDISECIKLYDQVNEHLLDKNKRFMWDAPIRLHLLALYFQLYTRGAISPGKEMSARDERFFNLITNPVIMLLVGRT